MYMNMIARIAVMVTGKVPGGLLESTCRTRQVSEARRHPINETHLTKTP